MAKTYLRCARPECRKILLKEDKDKGGCPCGSIKFVGVGEGSHFTFLERRAIKKGRAHWIDTGIKGLSPDAMNYLNEGYWERIKEAFGAEKANERREAARKEITNA